MTGHAKLNGSKTVEIFSNEKNKLTQTLKANHNIIATGARPRVIPGLEPDGKCVWTYFEALKPNIMPKFLSNIFNCVLYKLTTMILLKIFIVE